MANHRLVHTAPAHLQAIQLFGVPKQVSTDQRVRFRRTMVVKSVPRSFVASTSSFP
ncbi:MAG: hypothetical protein ACPLYD_02940 [Anaerolineae bacterium]